MKNARQSRPNIRREVTQIWAGEVSKVNERVVVYCRIDDWLTEGKLIVYPQNTGVISCKVSQMWYITLYGSNYWRTEWQTIHFFRNKHHEKHDDHTMIMVWIRENMTIIPWSYNELGRPCQEAWSPCRHHGVIMTMFGHDHGCMVIAKSWPGNYVFPHLSFPPGFHLFQPKVVPEMGASIKSSQSFFHSTNLLGHFEIFELLVHQSRWKSLEILYALLIKLL